MSQARTLRQNQTAAEQKLWSRLRNRQLNGYKFRRQVPLGRYIVDFSCYDARVVVELDGGQHGDDQRRARDQERTLWLESRGFRVLRFWNSELLQNMEGVLTRILGTLEKP
jgi:very-short-patch-repair endonuclease